MDFIAVGDLHFDSKLSQYSRLRDINAIIVQELQKVVSYARNNGVKYIVLLGDVSNSYNMSSDAHLKLIDLIHGNSDMYFIAITGNHDTRNREEHSLKVLQKLADTGSIQNLRVVSEPTVLFRKRGCPIHLMPWPVFTPKKDCLNIGHIEINGAQWDHGKPIDNERDTDSFYIGGHLHTKQELKGGKILIPGTLYQTSFGERADKFFAHVQWDGSNFSYELIPNKPSFELRNLVISKRTDLDLIKKDPDILYKLFIKDGVLLEANYLTDNPNVVKTNRFKTRQELQELITQEFFKDMDPLECNLLGVTEALNLWMLRAGIDQDLQDRTRKLFASITDKEPKDAA